MTDVHTSCSLAQRGLLYRFRRRYRNLHGESPEQDTGVYRLNIQWISSYIMIIAGNRASFRMFEDAWERVMRSPSGWHDRTPVSLNPYGRLALALTFQTGRIISRMSKGTLPIDDSPYVVRQANQSDIQVMDNRLAQTWNSLLL